jgi:hypothetical protein
VVGPEGGVEDEGGERGFGLDEVELHRAQRGERTVRDRDRAAIRPAADLEDEKVADMASTRKTCLIIEADGDFRDSMCFETRGELPLPTFADARNRNCIFVIKTGR